MKWLKRVHQATPAPRPVRQPAPRPVVTAPPRPYGRHAAPDPRNPVDPWAGAR
jgi:hypothetical protein